MFVCRKKSNGTACLRNPEKQYWEIGQKQQRTVLIGQKGQSKRFQNCLNFY